MRLIFLSLLLIALPTSAYRRSKFQNWFPKYKYHWIQAIEGPCHQELTNYIHNNKTQCKSPCACVADCLLQNNTGTIQSNFASAQVLLGLIPVTLGVLGPTVAEVSVLSTYRPLLAILISMGSPAISLSRTFQHVDVRETIQKPRSALSQACSNWLARRHVAFRVLFEILAYLAALAAMCNNIRNSVDVDMRTISGWRCGALYLPLSWSMLAVVTHGLGMAAVRFQLRRNLTLSLKSLFLSETYKLVSKSKENIPSEILFLTASVCAVVNVTYGILVLSSLVFISALEAVQVFALYAVSAIVCHVILLFESVNMTHMLNQESSADPRRATISME
jgi:hypothetical protein